MGVGSYIEMYTSVLSWQVYEIIWQGLTLTGIVFVPFLMIILKAGVKIAGLLSGVVSDDGNDRGVPGVMTQAIVEVMIGFFVLMFFAVPTTTLELANVSYQPRPTAVEETPAAVNPTAAGDPTTLNSAFTAVAAEVQLPQGWDLISRISSGFTFGVAYSLPRPVDLEESLSTLSTSHITEPGLSREVPAFHKSCYRQARAKLSNWLIQENVDSSLLTRIETNGQDDLNYIGSLTLVETPGLYRQCNNLDSCQGSLRAQYPVQTFNYSAARDSDYSDADIANNVPGKPYCDEWWTSIRDRVLAEEDEASETTWEWLRTAFGGTATDQQVEQARVMRVLQNTDLRAQQILGTEVGAQFGTPPNWNADVVVGGALISAANPVKKVTGVLAAAELGTTGFRAYSNWRKMSYLKKAIPSIIGIMLFVVPLVLPFVLVWKSYGIDAIAFMAITYFGIRFLSAIFEVGALLEDALQTSLFGDWSDILGYVMNGGIINAGESLLVLAFLLPFIFIFVPMVFMYIAGATALEAGRSIGFLQSSGTAAIGAGVSQPRLGGGKK